MTVPEGAPKHIEWGDRMAQALILVGLDVGRLALMHRKRYDSYKDFLDSIDRIQKALADLDRVRDEIINSRPDIPCDGNVYEKIGKPLGTCALRGYHQGECKLDGDKEVLK